MNSAAAAAAAQASLCLQQQQQQQQQQQPAAPFASWSSGGFQVGSGSAAQAGKAGSWKSLRRFLFGRPSMTLMVALLFLGLFFLALPAGHGEELELLTTGPSSSSSVETAQNGVPATGDGTAPMQPPQAGGVMEDLLHWAIQHSDPETLKEVMKKYQNSNLTLKDVYGQDVLDALFVDEAASIRHLVDQLHDFRNQSVPDEDIEAVLDRLEEFVEQVDNAGNLHKLGGLRPLMDCAMPLEEEPEAKRSAEIRAKALLVLGVATQNNPPVQADVLSLGGLERILALLPKCSQSGEEGPAYCGKLLFAISALVRNDVEIQESASDKGLFQWLVREGLMSKSVGNVKKAMGILETVIGQNPNLPFIGALVDDQQLQDGLASSLLDYVRDSSDVDAPEKALRLFGRLLESNGLLFTSTIIHHEDGRQTKFLDALEQAAFVAVKRCEVGAGPGDELCENLKALATEALDAGKVAQHLQSQEL